MEIETPVSATNLHTVVVANQTSLQSTTSKNSSRVEDFELNNASNSQASSNSSSTSYGGLRARNGRASTSNTHRVKFDLDPAGSSSTSHQRQLNGNGNQGSNESEDDSNDSITSGGLVSTMKMTTKTQNSSNYENLSANSISSNNTKSSKLEQEQQQRMTRKSLQLLNNKTSNCIQKSTNAQGTQPTVLLTPCGDTSPVKLSTSHNNNSVNSKIKELKTAVKNATASSNVTNDDDNALDGFTKDENNLDLLAPTKSSIKIEKIAKSESDSNGLKASNNRTNNGVVFTVDDDNNEDEDVDMTLDDSVQCPLTTNTINTNTNMDSILNDENSNTNQENNNNDEEASQQVNTDSNMEPVGGAAGGAKRGRKKKVRRTNLMVNGQFNE
jgi:hypothetical protein